LREIQQSLDSWTCVIFNRTKVGEFMFCENSDVPKR
jgi:hypothetical protein